MSRHLVLLGGPTGVGKSTTLTLLESRLANTGFLDVDALWRVSQEMADPQLRSSAHDLVKRAIDHYFDVGCERVVVAWVFARAALYQPLRDEYAPRVARISQLYLNTTADDLARQVTGRWQARGSEGSLASLLEYAESRRLLIAALPFPQVQCQHKSPCQVADALATLIKAV